MPKIEKYKKQEDLLDPGDHVEFSLTFAIKVRGQDNWVKSGVVVTVRDGEDEEAVQNRAKAFVTAAIDEAVEELK